MARHKVTHSADACCIEIQGDKRSPEPSTAVIKFPGGVVEVSRTSTGEYWCHFSRVLPGGEEPAGRITESRIDYTPEAWRANRGVSIPPIPAHSDIQHIAIRIARGE